MLIKIKILIIKILKHKINQSRKDVWLNINFQVLTTNN